MSAPLEQKLLHEKKTSNHIKTPGKVPDRKKDRQTDTRLGYSLLHESLDVK